MKRRILPILLALSMMLTLLPGMALAEDIEPAAPDVGKPTVGEDLYQVEVICQEKSDSQNGDHWWSAVGEVQWDHWVDDFTVGTVESNIEYMPETYPWRCPVTPKESLETYLGRLNDKLGVAHRLVTTELPVAYYYYNSDTGWEFIKNKDANPNCTVSTDGNNTWFLTIEVTCAAEPGTDPVEPGTDPVEPTPEGSEPDWLDSMVIPNYDMFTGVPADLPDTAGGKYLVLAQSGVKGDTDVYALYLNPGKSDPGNAVVTGNAITAAKLAMEDGELVGYLARDNQKVTLDQLLIEIKATSGGYTFANNGNYLTLSGSSMTAKTGVDISVESRTGGAYKVYTTRYLTLYVSDQHKGNANWQTNFWGPNGDQSTAGTNGFSYIYFLHAHVDDGKVVAAYDSEGAQITEEGGYFTILTGGYITVNGVKTFTVPQGVKSVRLPVNYASSLVMNGNGGFGVMGCTITMEDNTIATSVTRSGSAGSGVYFARTGDGCLYFAGEGAMTDYSSRNTYVPVWLDGTGDRTLKSVYIGEGVTHVGSNAFKFTSLSSVTLSAGLNTIGDSAFESCRIESVTIPGTVTDIGVNAFKGCLYLRSVQLPASVTTIGSNAFANCTRLRDVTVAGPLGSLPNGAFQAMSGYTKLNLVFQDDAPATAYGNYEGMLPFLHQNGAIVYLQSAPSTSLAASGGTDTHTDAYFAVLDGASLSGIDLIPGVLPELPDRDGVAFTGWQIDNTKNVLPGDSPVTGVSARVFTARWGDGYTVEHTVTIDGETYIVADGETMGNQMPPDPTQEGKRFAGWVDSHGNPFTADTPITGNTVVHATWTDIPRYTVTFDPNGGVLTGASSITLYEGETLTEAQIPSAAFSGRTFAGWFTADGSQFSLSTPITGDMTLTAHWTGGSDQPSGGGPSAPATPPPSAPSVPPEETPSTPPQEETGDPDALLSNLPFADVDKEAWYAQSVAYVYDRGLMKGVSDTSFLPTDSLTRGMMAQIIFNLAENPATAADSVFSDVSGKYYSEAVAWGTANGVLQGYGEDAFGGEDHMTREQIAVMLYRYAVVQGFGQNADMAVLGDFTDAAQVSDWARDAVAWAVENGLLKGRDNNGLDPRANITRSEVAAVLERYCKRFLP